MGLDDSVEIRSGLQTRSARSKTVLPANYGGTGNPAGAYSPTDLKSAYNLTASNLSAAGLSPNLNGAGQVVALIEFDGPGKYLTSDIATYTNYYSSYFGAGYTAPLTAVTLAGWTTGSPSVEATADIECVLNMAPGLANLVVFEGASSGSIPAYYSMLNYIATDTTDTGTGRVADIVSTSWHYPEVITNYLVDEQNVLEEMVSQGQTVLAAAGDAGVFGDYLQPDYGTPPNSSEICVVDPASQPYVTGVGGSEMLMANGAWSSEYVWNDGTIFGYGAPGGIGGGGVSSYWAIPAYQSNYLSMAGSQPYSTAKRNVPDVALNADTVISPYSIYCSSNGGWGAVGGTSLAAPSWAGFVALLNQERALLGYEDIGFANPFLYLIASSSRYGSDFHDVTVGNNGLSQEGLAAGFYAATGYDCASGWGSFNGANLMSDLALLNRTTILSASTAGGAAGLQNVYPDGEWSSSSIMVNDGYAATGLSAGPAGAEYVLWTAPSGAIEIWNMNPYSGYTEANFGPNSGWSATSISVGPDSHMHVLWNGPSNEISIWNIAPNRSYTYATYGPYAGWQAKSIAMDADNYTHILWTDSGEVSLWDIAPSGSQTSSQFGPYTGWQPEYLAVGTDTNARILWYNASTPQVALWIITSAGTYTSEAYSQLPSGAVPVGLAAFPDGDTNILLEQASSGDCWLWDIAPSWARSSYSIAPEGSGWSVVGISGYCG